MDIEGYLGREQWLIAYWRYLEHEHGAFKGTIHQWNYGTQPKVASKI